jgi:general secretion pathway protein L
MNKAWLRSQLELLEKAGLSIERVVPAIWPGDAPVGHFFESTPRAGGTAATMLSFADVGGQATMSVQGTLARSMLPQMSAQPTRWTATPATAAPAERWLSASVTVLTDSERALQSARSLWNLRQFDLAASHRGTLALRDLSRRFFSPGWRPVRIGLVSLAVLQLVGLNAWAWQQRSSIATAQREQEALLRATFPKVRAVLDAPLQMRRETDALRAAAGRAGDNDLEALLGAAASAWPGAQGAVRTLRFESGKLTLAAAGWNEQQLAQFRDRLRPGGWAVESEDGRVTLSRASAAGQS